MTRRSLQHRGGTAVQRGRRRETGGSAEDLLALQRQAGNRAVSQLVNGFEVAEAGSAAERSAERAASSLDGDPDGATAGMSLAPGRAVSSDLGRRRALHPSLAASLQRLVGRGRAIDAASRRPIEQSYGRSFAGVGLHDGPDADRIARSMGAAAFTTGNDVFLGSSVRLDSALGRHALAHELAHVGARPGGAVSGPAVVQRWSFRDLFRSKKEIAERKEKEEADRKEKQQQATDNLADSIAYERSLGSYLFNHPRANYAAASIIDKLITALIGDFDAASKQQQDQIAKAFGANSKKPLSELQSSAGQVGTTFEPVWAALRSGNLRERMTAIYNAMFGEFKSYVTKIMNDSAWQEAEAKGLNVEKLKRRKRQLKFTPFAKDLYRDPGNPVDRKNYSSWENTGTTRDAVKGTSARKVGELDEGRYPISLSERERQFQFPEKDEGEVDDSQLKWMEGGTFWKMRQDNKWVDKVEKSLHMPTVAGPSGTTLRFFQMWEFLKKPVPAADMRAAVLGYMLSSNDHSFHEMMMTAKDYGLPYTPGLRAYRDVAPLTEQELRANVAIDRTFPDEKAFGRKMDQSKFAFQTEDQEERVEDVEDDEGLDLTDVEKRVMQALVMYTDENPSAYKFMNNAFGGGLVSIKFMKFIKEDEHLAPMYAANKFNIKGLIEQSKELSFHAASALRSSKFKPHVGKVYRGQKAFFTGWVKPGAVISEKKFLSTSLDRSTAEGFASKGMGTKKLLIEMDSKTGRNVDNFSLVSGEDEVLFPPGSQFRIETAPTKNDQGFYVTRWTDVSEVPKDQPEEFKPEALKNIGFDAGDYSGGQVAKDEEEDDEDSRSRSVSISDADDVDTYAVERFFKDFDGHGDLITTVSYDQFSKITGEFSLAEMQSLDEGTRQKLLMIVGCDADVLNDAMEMAYGDPGAKIFSELSLEPPPSPPKSSMPASNEQQKSAPKSGIKATAPVVLNQLGVTLSLEQLAQLRTETLGLADVFSKEQLDEIMGGGPGVAEDMKALMAGLDVGDMWMGMQILKAMKAPPKKPTEPPTSPPVSQPSVSEMTPPPQVKSAPKSALKATGPLDLPTLGVTLSLEQLQALRDEQSGFAEVFSKAQLNQIMGGGPEVNEDTSALMKALNVSDMWLGMQLLKAMKASGSL
jgi:hypothetical protein